MAFDDLFKKKDCLACKGKGLIGSYAHCLACEGAGYSYIRTPQGPEGYPDNLELCADSEGIGWACLCGSEDAWTNTSLEVAEGEEVTCTECQRVYSVTKTYRIEVTVTLEGKTVAEGTY